MMKRVARTWLVGFPQPTISTATQESQTSTQSATATGLMSNNPQKFTSRAFAPRLAAFYAALFVTLGVQLPFLPVWLAAKGLDASAIGIVLAVPMIVRVVAIPMATRAADRRDALRAGVGVAAATAVAGYGALGFAGRMVAILAAYAVASAAYTPVFLLTDAYALRGLAERGRAYGPVRLWGSAAFIAASLGAGALLDVIPARDLIWLIVAAMGLTAAAACMLAPLSGGSSRLSAPHASGKTLLRDPAFLLVVGAASLVQASHALYYGFSTIDWQTAGFDGATHLGALAFVTRAAPPEFGATAQGYLGVAHGLVMAG